MIRLANLIIETNGLKQRIEIFFNNGQIIGAENSALVEMCAVYAVKGALGIRSIHLFGFGTFFHSFNFIFDKIYS